VSLFVFCKENILFKSREYPVSGGLPETIHRPEDKQNYVRLLQELRQQFDKKQYLLTVA